MELEDDIKMEHKEVSRNYVHWIGLAQDRVNWHSFLVGILKYIYKNNA